MRFTYNLGEVGCAIVNPKANNIIYPIYPVWIFLYPNDDKKYGINEFDFEKQIYHLAELINERFTNVLMGDFSWVKYFETSNNKLSMKIEYVMNKLSNDNPIKEKFWKGDLSWKDDLEVYLRINQIEKSK